MLLYEGKAKRIWSQDNGLVCQEFKDSITAFNGELKKEILGKGKINNNISCYLFEKINDEGIRTHFKNKIDEISMLCDKVDIIPLEVVVRNYTDGSFCKRYGVAEGQPIKLVEFFLKNDKFNDPLINENALIELKIVSKAEVELLTWMANCVNAILQEIFFAVSLNLIDIKLEFGKNKNDQIVLADEISPDTCRLHDVKTGESFDKDIFRKQKGNVIEAYKEVFKRLNIK